MFFERGGGRILLEDDWHDFHAPLLFVVPSGMVHGFQFERDTAGPILTISEDFMNEALSFADSRIASAIARPAIIRLDDDMVERHGLHGVFQTLDRDFRWIAPARSTALMASLVLLLVAISRLSATGDPGSPTSAAYAEKYEAFRKRVEQVFRQQPSVAQVAADLGLTVGRLTSICRAVAGVSPQQLMHQRLITEAKRQLLYSPHSATSISYMLGFRGPAYFSRFFKRATGESPVEFRKRTQATTLSSW